MSMSDEINPQWSRHLEPIADELIRLASVCGVELTEPGVIERIIRNDDSVCDRPNQIGFDKLRKLLIATFDSLGRAIDRIGTDETRGIVEALRRRKSG